MRFLYKKTTILGLLIACVLGLAIFLGRSGQSLGLMESALTNIFAPVQKVTSNIGYNIRGLLSSTGQIFTTYQDNQVLKDENERLKNELIVTQEVAAENSRLKLLLDYKNANQQQQLVLAYVIGRDSGTWTNTIIIDKGTEQGIQKDMPVVTVQGLVGHVSEVYSSKAKIRLLLDPRSAVGGIVLRSQSRVASIIEGNSSNPFVPKMVNMARDADIVKGDKLVTSGFGGIYPKGILIGEVSEVVKEEGGFLKHALVKPAVNFNKLEEVFIVIRHNESIQPGFSIKVDEKGGKE